MATNFKDLVDRTVIIAVSGPDGQTCASTTFDSLEEAKATQAQVFGTAHSFLAQAWPGDPAQGNPPPDAVSAVSTPMTVQIAVAGPLGTNTTPVATFANLEQAHKIAKRAVNLLRESIAYNVDAPSALVVAP